MTKPIVKREYVQEFTKGHGTYTVREQHLALDLERAYAMIEELRDHYRTRPYPYVEIALDLTRILEGDNG